MTKREAIKEIEEIQQSVTNARAELKLIDDALDWVLGKLEEDLEEYDEPKEIREKWNPGRKL